MRSFTFTCLTLLGALGLAGCVDETVFAPSSSGRTPISASTVAASNGATSYVLQGAGNVVPSGLAAAVQAAGGKLTRAIPQIGVAFAVSSDAGFAARAAQIAGVTSVAQDMVVQWVDPNESVVEAGAGDGAGGVGGAGIGDDERFFPIQWAPKAVHAPEAWAAGARGAGVRVAVIDGGMRNTHLDLRDNMDNAHSTSFVPGFTFNQDQDASGFSHATHVAGIIAAEDNAFGTIGIAPGATIIAVKALHNGHGPFEAVIAGIVYAATPISEGGAGADIINMSLGAIFSLQGRDAAQLAVALGKATTYAYQRGVTVFAAAGNAGLDFDHTANVVDLPAQSPHVLAISALAPQDFAHGATDFDDPASYTDFGQSLVEFAAPGGDSRLFIPFTPPAPNPNPVCTVSGFVNRCYVFDFVISPASLNTDNGYFFATGTSMASPAAAAVAALIIEKYGRIGPAGVARVLRQSADDLGKPGNDDFYGKGRVNAFRAVQ
jgi:lantibiotic leader peptide-processing serine protease